MEDYLNVARKAAGHAGELLKKTIKNPRIVKRKDGAVDLLTDADLSAQKLITSIIKDSFPDHGILAEESDNKLNNIENSYTWVIDPIDGTSAYSVGLPTYSSSIALLHKKEPIVGAVYVAMLDVVIYAAKGYGVYKENDMNKLLVRETEKLIDAAVGFDPGYHNREGDFKNIIAPLSDKVRLVPMLWSEAASLAIISAGIMDGYIQCGNPRVWDVAAGKLLVEEAGGIVTDMRGDKLDIFNIDGYIGGSKRIHNQIKEFLLV